MILSLPGRFVNITIGINAALRSIEKLRTEAEPKHLQALLRFAARAYRRPLRKTESDDLLAYYRKLRSQNQLSHEDATRECVVSVLMSPDFLYRFDLQTSAAPAASVCISASRDENSGWRNDSPAIELRSGEQVELLSLVQHAR